MKCWNVWYWIVRRLNYYVWNFIILIQNSILFKMIHSKNFISIRISKREFFKNNYFFFFSSIILLRDFKKFRQMLVTETLNTIKIIVTINIFDFLYIIITKRIIKIKLLKYRTKYFLYFRHNRIHFLQR